MKKIAYISTILLLSLLFSCRTFKGYIHNPMENPAAAKDIVVNSQAVYGYSPSPDSKRLKEFLVYDWTDKKQVMEFRQERLAYHQKMQELYQMADKMKKQGEDIESIARAVSIRRNEIRLETYKNNPEGLALVKKSNLENYGNENGGSPDYFFEKFASWEKVLEKAMSTNPGADACLGLYDDYYYTYMIDGK